MGKSKNRCNKCRNFEQYYTKGLTQFNKAMIGWCYANLSDVWECDCCDKYEVKTRTKISRLTLRNCLNDLLTELSTIRSLIEAEDE